jgi:hypothetical protein
MSEKAIAISRRALLQGMAAMTAFRADLQQNATSEPARFAAQRPPIAETTAGKVRGYYMNGVYAFKGIPYGAPTVGALRFHRAVKPQPWAGIRSCVHYGHLCPTGNNWGEPNDN